MHCITNVSKNARASFFGGGRNTHILVDPFSLAACHSAVRLLRAPMKLCCNDAKQKTVSSFYGNAPCVQAVVLRHAMILENKKKTSMRNVHSASPPPPATHNAKKIASRAVLGKMQPTCFMPLAQHLHVRFALLVQAVSQRLPGPATSRHRRDARVNGVRCTVIRLPHPSIP